jgi:AbrB family looped-hinge helix DNA binding protein
MEYSSLTIKGQVLIPKRIRNKFGFKPGSKVIFQETEQGVVIKPMDESFFDAMMGILEKGDLQKEKADLRNEERAKEEI